MELTPETLAKIIGPLKRQPAGDPRRRQTARIRVSIHGYLRLLYGGQFSDPLPVLISDLSTRGAGFVEPRALVVGEQFGLMISRRDGTPLSLICAVTRCQALKDGRYKIGATYVAFEGNSIAEEKAPEKKPSPADKRRARRVVHEKQVQIHLCRDGGIDQPITVIMQNFSARGVGLIHDKKLEAGEQFILRMRGKGGEIQQMLYAVAYSRATNTGKFFIGAEFTCLAPTAAA